MRLKWPSRHKENYPFLVTCSFLWVTKIAINFPLGKHFSWPITCEWKTEGKLGFRYHIFKEKLKEVILGQIFTLTSFLNNLLNFLRVILENAIGSTDKYKHRACPWPAYLNQSRLFLKTMQKEILTQLAILRVGSCANNLPWPYDWLLFCRCDWCDSGCWGKQIKTYQCSCWTDVDGGFDVSLDDSFCNVSSFSFPNIEYFFCCFKTQILAISSRQIFFKNVPE